MKKIIVAIDGYSSCGKSTLAKDVAQKLQYNYIDSGAMYRAVTLFCLKNKIDILKEEEVNSALSFINIAFKYNRNTHKSDTILNGDHVENAIRTMEVANIVGTISKYRKVRQFLVEQQQVLGKGRGIVMDGRDIGTVVFPDAELKIFITATMAIRVERRYNELIQKGMLVSREEIEKNLQERDYIDITRTESPLRKADGAKEIDNSFLSREEQADLVYFFALEAMKKN